MAADPDGGTRSPPGSEPSVWSPVRAASGALSCGHLHRPGGASLDETARRLSHEELAAARLLVGDGHDVHSLPESRRGGRRPDLLVCGETVEVKSFAPMEERSRRPTAQSVYNKLVDASGQAPHAVLIAYGSGLSETAARQGVARYAAASRRSAPALSSVRVVGDGYDLAWARRRSVELPASRPAPVVSSPGVGIGL